MKCWAAVHKQQLCNRTLHKGFLGSRGRRKREGLSFLALTFKCFPYKPRLTACSRERKCSCILWWSYDTNLCMHWRKTNFKFHSSGQMVDLLMNLSQIVLTSDGYESLLMMAAQLLKASGYMSIAYSSGWDSQFKGNTTVEGCKKHLWKQLFLLFSVKHPL